MLPIVKRVVIWAIALVIATVIFAVTHGVEQYRIARSVQTYVIIDEVKHEITPEEQISFYLIGDAIRGLPVGLVVASFLSLPLCLMAKVFRSTPAAAAYLVAAVLGGVVGGALSLVIYLIAGGWGPTFLLPAIAAGVFLAPAIVAIRRSATTA